MKNFVTRSRPSRVLVLTLCSLALLAPPAGLASSGFNISGTPTDALSSSPPNQNTNSNLVDTVLNSNAGGSSSPSTPLAESFGAGGGSGGGGGAALAVIPLLLLAVNVQPAVVVASFTDKDEHFGKVIFGNDQLAQVLQFGNRGEVSDLVNVYYDFAPANKLSPYIFGGANLVSQETTTLPTLWETTASSSSTDTGVAYQFGMGVTYATAASTEMVFGLRHATTPEFSKVAATETNEVQFGIRYNF